MSFKPTNAHVEAAPDDGFVVVCRLGAPNLPDNEYYIPEGAEVIISPAREARYTLAEAWGLLESAIEAVAEGCKCSMSEVQLRRSPLGPDRWAVSVGGTQPIYGPDPLAAIEDLAESVAHCQHTSAAWTCGHGKCWWAWRRADGEHMGVFPGEPCPECGELLPPTPRSYAMSEEECHEEICGMDAMIPATKREGAGTRLVVVHGNDILFNGWSTDVSVWHDAVRAIREYLKRCEE